MIKLFVNYSLSLWSAEASPVTVVAHEALCASVPIAAQAVLKASIDLAGDGLDIKGDGLHQDHAAITFIYFRIARLRVEVQLKVAHASLASPVRGHRHVIRRLIDWSIVKV